MDKTVISNKQVKSVAQEGITYLDNDGNEQFIDFEQCYQNYLRDQLSPESIEYFKKFNRKTDDDVPERNTRIKAWREIGVRQVLGPPWDDGPYVEFHTEPLIKCYFDSVESFHEFTWAIENAGWKTFDRS